MLTIMYKCYVEYDEFGCSKCITRDKISKDFGQCGLCINILSCVYGSTNGPLNNECTLNDWTYNTSFCSDEICSRLKTKRDCKQPCKWLIGSGCMLKINYDIKIDEYKNIFITYIIAFIILAILLFVSIILLIYLNNRNITPGYELLTMNMNLDNLPSPRTTIINHI